MTFEIYALDTGEAGQARCELLLGDHKEVFPLITTLWSRHAYQTQWLEALNALVEGVVNSCVLVTDVQPPEHSVGISYWGLFREGDIVYFQERFSRQLAAQLIGPTAAVEAHIPPRIQGTPEEHAQVSEWIVSIDELRQFVKSFPIHPSC